MDDAENYIDNLTRAGFFDADEILEIVVEERFEPGEVDEDWAKRTIADAFAKHAEDEATWTSPTDCDRLSTAFGELQSNGIVALENAGTTQSDGLSDVAEARHAHGNASPVLEGYCFYHGQDLERAVDGGGLYLSFGAIDGDDVRGIAIGTRIVETLRRHGFQVAWNGTTAQRISIPTLEWRRRRT